MELKITTSQILKLLQVLSWIIFIGLCIEAGGIIFSAVYTFAINPGNANNFWEKIDLSSLYQYDHGHFLTMIIVMVITAVLKAMLFYLIIRLLVEKKLNMAQPFNFALKTFLSGTAYLAFGIGLFSHCGNEYAKWLKTQKVAMPDAQSLNLGGADVWLFMAVILFVITQIVKRGIEIQKENDLTI